MLVKLKMTHRPPIRHLRALCAPIYIIRYLFIIMVLCQSTFAHAKDVYPKGCTPLVLHDPIALLSNKKPIVMMLHNLSDNDLWITHPTKNPGAQAGFSSLLQAGKWSALALTAAQKSFPLMCIESKPGHEQQISCADVMAVCQWQNSTLPQAASGNYWAGENMDLLPLKAYIERIGFILEAV